jgi:DNA (cytosine-5)-methyltransferase 1
MLNGLDLFSGIGGLSIALGEWVRPIAYCENDCYAQGVLLSRMAAGDIPRAPIWDDVRTLKGQDLPQIDILYGGFPCQDISVAGNGKGLEGERSGLFFEIVRLAQEIRPKFLFLENSPAIRTRGLDRVGKELARLGYDCRWGIVSAEEMGAPHERARWFLLAYSLGQQLWDKQRRGNWPEREGSAISGNHGKEESLADSDRAWELSEQKTREQSPHRPCHRSWWETEPNVG